ncbi:hypothetical protein SKUN_001206 [Spiroplasma kunkelii CR2-3x]|uniref:Uncharacterized protein n=1 Tax=Spiroplasma kunkelii CR2-3x TaxID=273035 RepID=A0A0K2JIL5_SPIKU|nr:hypothetical protein SKUN_001206 [Spiroplasma kunkelii CR2-3x]
MNSNLAQDNLIDVSSFKQDYYLKKFFILIVLKMFYYLCKQFAIIVAILLELKTLVRMIRN